MDKVIDVNEDADILHRLGILDSKLECPNKKKDFMINSNNNAGKKNITGIKQQAATTSTKIRAQQKTNQDLEAGDGWSGLSLSETSTDNDDSDCLFDRQTRVPSTSASVSTSSCRQLRRPARRAGGGGAHNNGTTSHRGHYRHHRRHRETSMVTLSSCWKLLSMLCAAAFLGFLMSFQQQILPPSILTAGIEYTEHYKHILRIYFAQAFALLFGSSFAAFTILRFNPFAILMSVMLLFIPFCFRLLNLDAINNNNHDDKRAMNYWWWNGLLFCVVQAFVIGTIKRGILLLTPLWTGSYQRILFLTLAIVSFGASINLLLQQQQQSTTTTEKDGIFNKRINNFSGINHHQKNFRRDISNNNNEWGMQQNGRGLDISNNSRMSQQTAAATIPSYFQIVDLDTNNNINQGADNSLANKNNYYNLTDHAVDAEVNSANNNGSSKQEIIKINSTSTTTAKPISAGEEEKPPAAGGAPTMFKTKTEENAFRRKEVEENKRKKEELEKMQKQQQTMPADHPVLLVTSTTNMTVENSTSTTALTLTTTSVANKNNNSTIIVKQQQMAEGGGEAMMGGGSRMFIANNKKTPLDGMVTTDTTNINVDKVLPSSTLTSSQNLQTRPPPQYSLNHHQKRRAPLLTGMQLLILCLLISPLVLGFCCCCMLDHPCCPSGYKQLPKLLAPTSAHPAETFICQLLSFLLWALHSSLVTMLELTTIFNAFQQRQQQQSRAEQIVNYNYLFGLFSPMAMFWLCAGSSQLILAIWPSIASNTTAVHAIYFILILACSMLHFVLPARITSATFVLESGEIAIMAIASTLPLLLYVWYCEHSKCGRKNASARFIFSLAVSKLCTPVAYVWWQDAVAGTATMQTTVRVSPQILPQSLSAAPSTIPPSLSIFVLGTLTLGYALFLLLLTKLRKMERQQQISELSSALNGKSSAVGPTAKHSPPKRLITTTTAKKTTRTKGQYSLLENNNNNNSGGSGKKKNGTRTHFPAFNLISALDDTSASSSEMADLVEMESIGGGEDDLHQMVSTMKKKKTTIDEGGTWAKTTRKGGNNNNSDTDDEAFSVEEDSL